MNDGEREASKSACEPAKRFDADPSVESGGDPEPNASGDGEEALEAVEREERRLRERLESSAKILALMKKREGILAQRAEMLENANDPGRLLGKGKGAGQ